MPSLDALAGACAVRCACSSLLAAKLQHGCDVATQRSSETTAMVQSACNCSAQENLGQKSIDNTELHAVIQVTRISPRTNFIVLVNIAMSAILAS